MEKGEKNVNKQGVQVLGSAQLENGPALHSGVWDLTKPIFFSINNEFTRNFSAVTDRKLF